jgi:transcriptional regulator GlxA family with amidase domain
MIKGETMNLRVRATGLAMASLVMTFAMPVRSAAATIGILVFDGFLTSDVTAPVEVFGAASKKAAFSSYKVLLVAATRNKEVVSEEGLRVVADKTIYDDLKLDVLLAPSAYAMDRLLENKDLIGFIKKQSRSASWMASNCSGAQLLAEAGALDGKHATTWAGGEKQLAAAYPKIKVEVDKNVVVDDKVITSNGGPVSYQAAFELLARLSSPKFADEVSAQIQFGRLRGAFR